MNQKELEDLICELYGIEEPTPLIKNQISKFRAQHGYSFKDIGRAVYYYVSVLKRTLKIEGGIGIVPYYIKDALRYFELEKRRIEKLEREGKKLKRELNKEENIIKVKGIKREKKGIVKVRIEDL